MHDYSAEMNEFLKNLGYREFGEDKEASERINALISHLLGRTQMRPEKKQIVISSLEVDAPAKGADGSYTANVSVELNNSGSSDQDNIVFEIYVNDTLVESKDIELGTEKYEFNVAVSEESTVKAIVSGTQVLPIGVYFYAAEPEDVNGDGIATSCETSQNLVGVAAGPTPVLQKLKFLP